MVSLPLAVADATSADRTPLGTSDSALLGMKDAMFDGMLVNCGCAVAPAAMARPIKEFLILKRLREVAEYLRESVGRRYAERLLAIWA